MHEGAQLLWPEVEDLSTLMRMRVESGHTAFEREKQNSPIDPQRLRMARILLRRTHLVRRVARPICPSRPWPSIPAKAPTPAAATIPPSSCSASIATESSMSRPTSPAVPRRRSSPTASSCSAASSPHAFGIEANQFQDLLAGEFEAEFRRRSPLGARPVPIENTVNKLVRIRRLGQYLSTRRFRFKTNSPGTKLLVEQLQEFPLADHDDGPDALEMALRLANDLAQLRTFNDGLGNRLPIM